MNVPEFEGGLEECLSRPPAASTGGTGSGILLTIEDPTEMHSLTKSEVIISCGNDMDIVPSTSLKATTDQNILSSSCMNPALKLIKSSSHHDDEEEEEKKYEEIIKKSQKCTGKISKDDFSMIKVIGTGTYGKVLLVKKKDNSKLYAMKVLKKKYIR